MDLETFLQHLQENHSNISISKDVRDLLQLQLDTAIKEEVCHFEDIADIENYSHRDTNIEMESKIPCELCGTLWNSKEAGKSDLFFSSASRVVVFSFFGHNYDFFQKIVIREASKKRK